MNQGAIWRRRPWPLLVLALVPCFGLARGQRSHESRTVVRIERDFYGTLQQAAVAYSKVSSLYSTNSNFLCGPQERAFLGQFERSTTFIDTTNRALIEQLKSRPQMLALSETDREASQSRHAVWAYIGKSRLGERASALAQTILSSQCLEPMHAGWVPLVAVGVQFVRDRADWAMEIQELSIHTVAGQPKRTRIPWDKTGCRQIGQQKLQQFSAWRCVVEGFGEVELIRKEHHKDE